jgi:hypothetical protein
VGCTRRLTGARDTDYGSAVATTEITLITGAQYAVQGEPETVEASIVGAARGSIMQLAWLTDATTGKSFAVNPEHVVTLRDVSDA